jgi:hypothetical protein
MTSELTEIGSRLAVNDKAPSNDPGPGAEGLFTAGSRVTARPSSPALAAASETSTARTAYILQRCVATSLFQQRWLQAHRHVME